ncbi:terminase small subunit, partial [Yersinia enterocolitica]
MAKLTDKQELFAREYLKDLNATQAAIRAGYSEKTAQVQSSRLLSNVMVQQRVSELAAERNSRVGIDADYVLRQAVKLHERCMQEV